MLTVEWLDRLESWHKELAGQAFCSLGRVKVEGFTTLEQLTPQQAARGKFRAMPPGTPWGGKWEYLWLRCEVVTPKDAAGKPFVLHLHPGSEGLIFIDGKVAQARDHGRWELTLAKKGRPGRKFRILAEVYGGHGPAPCHSGPTPPGKLTVPEPPRTQKTLGDSHYGVREEDIYQLWIDVKTLWELRNNMPPESLRVADIDAGLRDFTTIVDLELPREQMLATVREARRRLRPLLECRNGATMPQMYAFGHAHLDTAWLWPLAETERKAARTLSNQLQLIAEYPEYKFLMSQPAQYEMLQNRYPELFQRMKKAVRDGNVIPDGGMWVEADTNIAGGEALIRQFLHGKRYFREHFGVENEILWLPDVFGYSGALPQIMQGCGVKYFATAKIFWNYHGGENFPYNTFHWEGIDGSSVLVHLCNDYNSRTSPEPVIHRWKKRVQMDGLRLRLFPFGWGDGGGGPARDHIEYIRREKDLEGCPKVRMAAPIEYFRDVEKIEKPALRYVGELYFQTHRGTYTAQAKTKKGNRKSELALREAEMWAGVAGAMGGYKYPAVVMDRAWKTLLLNQFHDILPGSSIHRVYEEAERDFASVIATAGEVADKAAAKITHGPRGVTVLNSLNWPRTAMVALPRGYAGATDIEGEELVTQEIDGCTYAEVTVPPCGWTTITPVRKAATEPEEETVTAQANLLENDQLRVRLNRFGEITSIFDKAVGRELAAGACNRMLMYKDVPSKFDAWDIDSMYPLTPVELRDAAEVEVVSQGPLAGRLRVRRKLNESWMTQEITLRRGSRRVDFRTCIDWRERHKMLKAGFRVNYHANEAIHEIQFGHIRRPNHMSRPFDADRFEVSNHKWSALAEEESGFAVLNDCKYGLNVLGDAINLTLLRSPMAPDMTADLGEQEFTYSFYAWNGSLAGSGVVHESYALNVPVRAVSGSAGETSMLSTDAPNIIVEALKPAEDSSGDVVVRLYESMRTRTVCTLRTHLPAVAAEETDMLEQSTLRKLRLDGGEMELEFRPFEIKTIRLRMKKTR